MTDIQIAKELLCINNCTLVLVNGRKQIISHERGIKPLIDLHNSKEDLSGFSAADKVIGKSAAFMYLLLRITDIYTNVISQPALDLLNLHKVRIKYNKCVENINNRSGSDVCPMESAVLTETSPIEAYKKILCKLNEFALKK